MPKYICEISASCWFYYKAMWVSYAVSTNKQILDSLSESVEYGP